MEGEKFSIGSQEVLAVPLFPMSLSEREKLSIGCIKGLAMVRGHGLDSHAI